MEKLGIILILGSICALIVNFILFIFSTYEVFTGEKYRRNMAIRSSISIIILFIGVIIMILFF